MAGIEPMKRCFAALILIICLCIAVEAQQAQPMARTLVVEVFSIRKVSTLTITPLGHGEWIRTCPTCRKQPITAPMTVTVQSGSIVLSSGVRSRQADLSGAFRMQPANSTSEVSAAGLWNLKPLHGELRLLLTLDSEQYVGFALAGEADPHEPMESLQAMAVTIRTFALENANRHAEEGFNLCDSTHCQSLRFGKIASPIQAAVLATAGETLWYQQHRATVFYTQNCGGETEDARAVWPQIRAPYLATHRDPYCARHSPGQWHTEIPLTQLQTIVQQQGWRLPSHIDSIRIIKRTSSGRVSELELSQGADHVAVSASSLRFALDRSLGWNQLRSDSYTLALKNGIAQFNGQGFGHGVGLCQAGAFEMAIEGHSYGQILDFYFPGTTFGFTPHDHGWQQAQEMGWTLWTPAASPALSQDGNRAWGEAQALFPPRTPVKPVVRQFPTTELFRQSAGEPGWILASTRTTQIFLQPNSVLQPRNIHPTLLHEFLHVLVEQEASPNAPLWLREGLVEALAPEGALPLSHPGNIEISALDALLAHPADEATSQREHAAAALLTQQLLSHYGLEQVRQWLRSGNLPDAVIRSLPQVQDRPPAQSPSNQR
jgi:stage II sporulation protein D